jgi:hypothetical protein
VSGSARLDREALRELETLVRTLGDELAGARSRAERAEARLRAVDRDGRGVHLLDRVSDLERENTELRGRLEAAAARVRQMIDRLRFLRQQSQRGAER